MFCSSLMCLGIGKGQRKADFLGCGSSFGRSDYVTRECGFYRLSFTGCAVYVLHPSSLSLQVADPTPKIRPSAPVPKGGK